MSANIVWKLIPGFEGRYRVSSCGKVESSRDGYSAWAALSTNVNRSGYRTAYLSRNNKTAAFSVHRLVATLFLSADPLRPCVNHKDGNRLNCEVSNLEWCTRRENMLHAWRTGLCKPHKLTASDVRMIRGGRENDTKTAAMFGVSQVLITKIRAGKLWKHIA